VKNVMSTQNTPTLVGGEEKKAVDVLEKILIDNGHDLESLAPRFEAELLIELLNKSGWTIVRGK